MHALHNPRGPGFPGLFEKGGNVRQSAADNNIVQFPRARSANRYAMIEDFPIDNSARMPFGLCLMIWAALAVIGWGAFDAAAKLI
jgi:hypothetical protein